MEGKISANSAAFYGLPSRISTLPARRVPAFESHSHKHIAPQLFFTPTESIGNKMYAPKRPKNTVVRMHDGSRILFVPQDEVDGAVKEQK